MHASVFFSYNLLTYPFCFDKNKIHGWEKDGLVKVQHSIKSEQE